MKAVYIGIQTPGTTSQLRSDALAKSSQALEWTVIDTDRPFLEAPRWQRSLWFRLRTGPAVSVLNRMVLDKLNNQPCDLVWIDKGVCLWPETVRHIRKLASTMIYYTPDTSFLANRSRFFNATASLYDLIVTTKSLEVSHYEQLVPRDRVMLLTQSFDSQLHRPRCSFENKRDEVVLIGLCEPDRENCINHLLEAGLHVRVGGSGWERFVARHRSNSNLYFEGQRVFGDRYASVLSSASVGLGLVTKRFQELHTTRTFEIPACGTALATERNAETTSVFRDGDVIFFSDYPELARRLCELRKDPVRLKAISMAGERRVRDGKYSNDQMVSSVLAAVGLN